MSTSKHGTGEAGKNGLSVKVYNNNIDKAIKQFKKKVMADGLLKEIKNRMSYERPGEKRRRARAEARRRWLKTVEQRKQNEGY